MNYNVNGVTLDSEDVSLYCESLINKIFAILGIYEDCENAGNFDTFSVYVDRVCLEIAGGYEVLGINNFLSLSNILAGIKESEELNHKKVKSIVFHCISIVKKTKV